MKAIILNRLSRNLYVSDYLGDRLSRKRLLRKRLASFDYQYTPHTLLFYFDLSL